MFEPLRYQEFNIVACSSSKEHRILKVLFHRDGSVFVMFPSFKENEGLVGKIRLAAGAQNITLSLAKHGKIASHRVKYSHHPDGRAHFSQDGLVRTEIKKQSVSLDREQLHMFTVYAEGLEGFDAPRGNDNTPKLVFPIYGGPPGVKIIASWCELRNMGSTDAIRPGSGEIIIRLPNGQSKTGWLVGPPRGNPYDRFGLLVTPEEIFSLSSDVGPCLSFLGGFDSRQIALDHSKETSFLVMKYPCTSPEDLRRSIQSIDLHPRPIH